MVAGAGSCGVGLLTATESVTSNTVILTLSITFNEAVICRPSLEVGR